LACSAPWLQTLMKDARGGPIRYTCIPDRMLTGSGHLE
jgi:hypothetical protein